MRWTVVTFISLFAACGLFPDLSSLGGSDAGATDGGLSLDGNVPSSCNGAALQPGSPWPVQGGCVTHIGLSGRVGPKTAKPKWSLQLSGIGSCAPPVIANDGTIVVGSEDNTSGIIAVNPDGTLRWRADAGNMSAAAALGNHTIYGGAQAKLAAVDFGGTVQWLFDSGVQVDSSPVIGSDGTIYFGAADDHIYAVHPDGSIAWSFPTDAGVDESPAIAADGTVICGSSDFTLYALHRDGTFAWSHPTGGVVSTAAIAPDGTIYVGSTDTKLYAFTASGTVKWIFSGAGGALRAPAIGPDGTIYVGSADDALYAVRPDGTQRWRFVTQGVVSATPVVGADGTVYVVSKDKSLYAIAPDGTLAWSAVVGDTCDWLTYAGLGADGTLYVTVNTVPDGGTQTAGFLLAFAP